MTPDASILIRTQAKLPEFQPDQTTIEDLVGKRERVTDVEQSFAVAVREFVVKVLYALSQVKAQVVLKPYLGQERTFSELMMRRARCAGDS